jgi:RHS repeat-associated protein
VSEAQGDGAGAAFGEQARQDGKGQSGDYPAVGEASWVAAGRNCASGGDIDFGGVQGAKPGAEFVKLVNNVPEDAAKQTPISNPEKKLFYHNDHLGGVNVITDISGTRVQLNEYDPWGKVSRTEGNVDPEKRFTGQILDPESGLYYYGARYYDPELARFISPDPIVPSPGDPQSLNRYSYVRNNPVKYIDPTGHSFWSAIGNFFKNLFRRPQIFFATLAVGLVTGGAAYLATGSFLIAGAIGGAFAGLTGAGMSGGNLWQGMLIGMVGGAVGGGVYGAVGGGLEGVLAGAFAGGFVAGGLGTAFNGGNFFQNAMVGGITSSIMAGAMYGVAKGAAWLWEKWNAMPGTPEGQKSAAGLQFTANARQTGDTTTTSDICGPVCGEEAVSQTTRGPSTAERVIGAGALIGAGAGAVGTGIGIGANVQAVSLATAVTVTHTGGLAAFSLTLEVLHTMGGLLIATGTAGAASLFGGYLIGTGVNMAIPYLGQGKLGADVYFLTH